MKTEEKDERKSFIKIKGKYSERSGIVTHEEFTQLEDFDGRTREIMSNYLYDILKFYFDEGNRYFENGKHIDEVFSKVILSDVFGESTRKPGGYYFHWYDNYYKIDNVIQNASYNEVLDIIEYIFDWLNQNLRSLPKDFYEIFNQLFEKECVGYRFVEGKIVEITDKNEIAEIESACHCQYEGCRSHIRKAVEKLADRENKDYKNSIKESISAIEAICRVITEDSKATLGEAIKKLKKSGLILHPALEQAFDKLYGYTSDEGGVRHSEGLFESNVSFEDAKYMLVSCSAFLNYLIAEYGEISCKND